jgi:hypothetical protein
LPFTRAASSFRSAKPSRGNDACAREKLMSDDHNQRKSKYFREFSVIYADAIRSSDFKANIVLLFLPC